MKNLHMRRGRVKTDYSESSYVGLLVGYVSGRYICDNCSVTGELEGEGYVGGLIGKGLYSTTIVNSYADVRVQGKFVGAILGYNDGTLYNSHGRGTVTGKSWSSGSPYSYAGGLAGGEQKTINSYAWAEVLGDYSAGSLIGNIGENPVILQSYGVGSVRAQGESGGLFGRVDDTTIILEDSFWDIEATGQSLPRGDGEVVETATGLTTTQMQSSCFGAHTGDDICALGASFVFRQGSYPLLKKCSNCDSDSPTYLEELVGGQLD